jgi:hypothetical protein
MIFSQITHTHHIIYFSRVDVLFFLWFIIVDGKSTTTKMFSNNMPKTLLIDGCENMPQNSFSRLSDASEVVLDGTASMHNNHNHNTIQRRSLELKKKIILSDEK